MLTSLATRLSKNFAMGLLVLAMAASAQPAHAALVFTLDQDGCTGGCGAAPYGTVTLTQLDLDTVQVRIDLIPVSRLFVDTGGPHHTLSWNGLSGMSVDNVVGVATLGGLLSSQSASPFGNFDYAIDCNNCGPGASNAKAGPLTFDVSRIGGLLETDFTANTGGYYFAVDIINNPPTGNTGNVGTMGPGVPPCPPGPNGCGPGGFEPIPEPFSLALFGTGLLGLGLVRRRRLSVCAGGKAAN
jgi:hypothetical protein